MARLEKFWDYEGTQLTSEDVEKSETLPMPSGQEERDFPIGHD